MQSVPEMARLENIAKNFTQFDKDIKVNRYRAQTICSLVKGSRILEMGCADGLVTEQLVARYGEVVALDGAAQLLVNLKSRLPQVRTVCALFEEYEPEEGYDTIVMGHVLEHVEDPLKILGLVREWLRPGGVLIITVPNAESLHRRLGLRMGLLQEITELGADDYRIGHRRLYTLATLREEIAQAGLHITHLEGIMFKPLSNRQMIDWEQALLDACYQLGKDLPPQFAGELCVVCTH